MAAYLGGRKIGRIVAGASALAVIALVATYVGLTVLPS